MVYRDLRICGRTYTYNRIRMHAYFFTIRFLHLAGLRSRVQLVANSVQCFYPVGGQKPSANPTSELTAFSRVSERS